MRLNAILLLILIAFFSCKEHSDKVKKVIQETEAIEYLKITHPEYDLHKPLSNPKAVLFLFGGYTEVAEDIKKEFEILELAKINEIAIIYSNYNHKLWLEESEKNQLAQKIQQLFEENQLPNNNIYFGGFSSGGNIALLISDYLTENKNYQVHPKGVFIVDSPIDLAELFLNAEIHVQRNFSEVAVQESKWLIEMLDKRFGNPNNDISEYEKFSAFTLITGVTEKIKHLKDTKLRMYTEPDSLWWKQNRMIDFEQTNAFQITKLYEALKTDKFSKTEFISTENKGYRANGDRHPHSWAIVEQKKLIEWMLLN
jgi:hypothetical protein